MSRTPGPKPAWAEPPSARLLLGYVADLELEVDRLRKRADYLRQEAQETVRRTLELTAVPDVAPVQTLAEVEVAIRHLAGVIRDSREPPGYHPAYDQVVALAMRPLIEQIFRWQQRVTGHIDVALQLDLQADHVEWFPARLRHILENLLSNALRYRDPNKHESWVRVRLRATESDYEFQLSDNGVGFPALEGQAFELLSRAAPVRAIGLGVGLPVVKLLIEQSGGTLTTTSEEGRGTELTFVLPRYDVADFLT